MANSTGIRNVKVADPGLSMVLDLANSLFVTDGKLHASLKVDVHILKDGANTDYEHVSTLMVNGPIVNSANGFCIVAPYGCDSYHTGNVDVRVEVSIKRIGETTFSLMHQQTFSGAAAIQAEAGRFIVGVSMVT